ncbi:MAG: hypothetical protein OQK45_06695 [Sulfurovum sp.]|nr:hypothetical protein [Sulfurovum sp.]
MKNTFKLGLLLIGALALSLTFATAEGKCGDSQGMMNNEGKCDSSKKSMMNNEGKCDSSKKTEKCSSGKCDSAKKEPKPAPMKGKCGQGKCG